MTFCNTSVPHVTMSPVAEPPSGIARPMAPPWGHHLAGAAPQQSKNSSIQSNYSNLRWVPISQR